MSDDARDWVWQHSRARGNARLVLLAVAEVVEGPDAVASMGTTEVMSRLNASRSTARDAVDAALATGELVVDEPAKGSRATRYKIPGAVGYRRVTGPESGPLSEPTAPTGPESGPLDEHAEAPGPESGPLTPTGPNLGPLDGPESGPLALWSEHPDECGTRARASFKTTERLSEGVSARDVKVAVIPEFARPVVDQISAAGIYPAWTLTPAEWIVVHALIKRSGESMLAAAAVQAAQRARTGVAHARYFLRAWQALPPAPEPGTVPAAPAAPARSNVVPFPSADRPGRAAQAAGWYADLLTEEQ
ncbi:hypothetical protein KQH42_07190 [Streptomyces sp. CHA1]|nr:hypothetical protein [Streptomyces sp. G11C]MCO6700299.1 hypothetical protein [Streptomyces sp. CHB9.2]MCO6706435.1 hypothetical protein [Streptomyces sp. CHA3]MCO6712177.1 hypothetical protein [Streptomyces sp. CHB19.2]MCO6718611.1 hypothetical protein [Streptomyces sp. Vc714c-19]MCO6724214.1 hypothetical protein [Streptomyces sp. CHA16]MCO6730149.1 hypothetical protein [Streptomyces sp. EL9]MCO6735818.1 hypothetical protein [Streptomyces sp. CHA15]MCO6742095.1 hypothetical protein [Str